MYLDPNGIAVIEESDPIAPFQTLMNTMQAATSDVVSDLKSDTSFASQDVPVTGTGWSSEGNIWVAKFGPMVSLWVNKSTTSAISYGTQAGTLPALYRPGSNVYGSMVFGGNFGANNPAATLRVQPNGGLILYVAGSQSGTSSWVRGTMSWWN